MNEKLSLENAKTDKLFYVVFNVIVYRKADNRCLVLKRSSTEKAHPNKYCVPGGKLEWKDLQTPSRMNGEVIDFEDIIEDVLFRETLEEAGVKIQTKNLQYINNVAYIRPDGVPSILVKFTAEYESGDVVLEEGSFTNFAWVNSSEIDSYDCILGIKEEVKKAIILFSKD